MHAYLPIQADPGFWKEEAWGLSGELAQMCAPLPWGVFTYFVDEKGGACAPTPWIRACVCRPIHAC